MASRQWKYYIETNEWTRATCALMACLFTRDQMANSTVLGRGGSQRARLPSNLVAYVVNDLLVHLMFLKYLYTHYIQFNYNSSILLDYVILSIHTKNSVVI
ncbi:unnamed protein product [Schistosoma margrebowiei]|uniref:Uncharacterized protein n=1 Tax=Schistosoma margrebowiei TaxID=48269 RepID=A0A183N5J1_9TREM|nr:unnamed protein product [Schistosoma margrebowiei]